MRIQILSVLSVPVEPLATVLLQCCDTKAPKFPAVNLNNLLLVNYL